MSADTNYELLQAVLDQSPQGWAVEFGVYSGTSLRMIAEKMPGKVSGSVTRIKVFAGRAPRSAEASSNDFFSFSIEEYIGSTAKGSMFVTRPSITSQSE